MVNVMGKKILFFQWNAFMQEGMEASLKSLGIEYDVFYYIFKDWDRDDEFVGIFRQHLKDGEYERVLSVNFSPLISDVCQEQGITYVSWVYDAPLHIRKTESLKNSCNIIYFFDRVQCDTYRKSGVEGACHLPLAVDCDVFSDEGIRRIISGRTEGRIQGQIPVKHYDDWYECDVSLVGKLYKSDYEYLLTPLSGYHRGYLEGMVEAQKKVYGGYFLGDMITDDLLDGLNKEYRTASQGKFTVSREELEFALGTEVTGRERFMALALLQNRCRVNLYSKDKDERLPNVSHKGYVDYYTQMPRVFRNSKINLNISLKLIQSGIPLRVLDVLGCKGFLITNYQPEIMEYFTPGQDLVVYEDIVDLVSKVEYYLIHEDERKAIAANGYNRCQEIFGFDDRMRTLLGM